MTDGADSRIGENRPARSSGAEIKITPEMIAAGVESLMGEPEAHLMSTYVTTLVVEKILIAALGPTAIKDSH